MGPARVTCRYSAVPAASWPHRGGSYLTVLAHVKKQFLLFCGWHQELHTSDFFVFKKSLSCGEEVQCKGAAPQPLAPVLAILLDCHKSGNTKWTPIHGSKTESTLLDAGGETFIYFIISEEHKRLGPPRANELAVGHCSWVAPCSLAPCSPVA